jgi:hypothetical protein
MKNIVLLLVENQIGFDLSFSDFEQSALITIAESTFVIYFKENQINISDDSDDTLIYNIEESYLIEIIKSTFLN